MRNLSQRQYLADKQEIAVKDFCFAFACEVKI